MGVIYLAVGVSRSTVTEGVVVRLWHDCTVFLEIELGQCWIGTWLRELWPLQLVEALSDSEAGSPLAERTGQMSGKFTLGRSRNRFEARSLSE